MPFDFISIFQESFIAQRPHELDTVFFALTGIGYAISTIVVLWLWDSFASRGKPLGIATKILIGFAISLAGLILIHFRSAVAGSSTWIFPVVLLIFLFADCFVSPVLRATLAKNSVPQFRATYLGAWDTSKAGVLTLLSSDLIWDKLELSSFVPTIIAIVTGVLVLVFKARILPSA